MKNKALNTLDELERALLERAPRRLPDVSKAPEHVSPDAQRLRAFEYYEFNVGLPVVEQSDRARALREIARIATWRGWAVEVTRAMDREGVSAVGEMSDAGVFNLCGRMKSLEGAAQTGCEVDPWED